MHSVGKLVRMSLNKDLRITTTEMHTGGEPLRIVKSGVKSGYPPIQGSTVLEKRRYARKHLDHLRRFLIEEPRGHHDMYGALLVDADIKEAHFGVLFIHNEGYSTMCGHAVIALGRYAVDCGLVARTPPETQVNIQCPCGLVKSYVECDEGSTSSVRFHSVPAFAFAIDVEIDVAPYGRFTLDIGYGGAFYALVDSKKVNLCVRTSRTSELIEAASKISDAVRAQVTMTHPDSPDLAFLYGTILTDGKDALADGPTANVCIFADREVDRCPTGSGVTARVAVQYKRGLIGLNQTRVFESGATGSKFTGKAVGETKCGQFDAVTVEVSGRAFYSGSNTFTLEENDDLKAGFLLR